MRKTMIGFAVMLAVTTSAYANEKITEDSFAVTNVPSHQSVMFTIVEKNPEDRKREGDYYRDRVRGEAEGIARDRVNRKHPRGYDRFRRTEDVIRDIDWNIKEGKRKGEDAIKI